MTNVIKENTSCSGNTGSSLRKYVMIIQNYGRVSSIPPQLFIEVTLFLGSYRTSVFKLRTGGTTKRLLFRKHDIT